jgi:type IV pilus assembly protein PilE
MIGKTSGHRGFTLIELLVTVAIVAILAAIALPSYSDYVKRGKIPDATSALSNGRVTMEQWFQDNRTYVGATCPSSTTNFAIGCALAASTYTITATGAGSMTGFTYTIDQTGAKATTASPWNTNATCWVTKPGGPVGAGLC